MAKDPVCGMEVDEKKSRKETYMGRTYYFCSPACQQEFKADPKKFVK